MSKFIEFDVVFENKEDGQMRDLGLPDKSDGHLDKAMIDLEEVQSFYACYRPGEDEKRYTKLHMKRTDDVYTIAVEYTEFRKYLKLVLKNLTSD